MQPSAKRQKGDDSKESKVHKPLKRIPLRVMLMSRPDDVLSEKAIAEIQNALKGKVEARYFQERTENGFMKLHNVTDVFGELPVQARALIYSERIAGMGAPQVIQQANANTFVPIANAQSPLGVICNCIGDWLARPVGRPLQKQKTNSDGATVFPIVSSDQYLADPGPFHMILFPRRDTWLSYTEGAATLDVWKSFDWEFNENKVNAQLRWNPIHRSTWIDNGRQLYPVIREVLRALAGKPQDITTFYAYHLLAELSRLLKIYPTHSENSDVFLKEAGEIWYSSGVRRYERSMPDICIATAPVDCLALRTEGDPTLAFTIAMIHSSVRNWLGLDVFNQDDNRVSTEDAKAFATTLDMLLEGKVEEDQFDKIYDELESVLFGNIPEADFTQAEHEHFEVWLGLASATMKLWLRRHLYPKDKHLIPQPDNKTGTLLEKDQKAVFEQLSPYAQHLVRVNPAIIINAVIWAEDPQKVSEYAVLRTKNSAERYRTLQRVCAYYDDTASNPVDCLVPESGQNYFTNPENIEFESKLFRLHPETKLQPFLVREMAGRRGDRPVSDAERQVMKQEEMRKLILLFAAKLKVHSKT